MREENERPLIQSVSRAVAILQCFSQKRELGLTEISKMVGLHKSTAAGIIHTLKAERFLEQDKQTGKLHLGSALYLLTLDARPQLEDICEPYLSSLLAETGETVNLAIRDGREVVYIAKKESPHSMRISTNVGKRMPMYCTAIGKAIMAHMDPKAVEKMMAETEFHPYTDKTIVDSSSLLQSLDRIRVEGVAYDFEELEYGLICVAAPLFQRLDEPVGAISVSGPTVRMDEKTRVFIAQLLQKVAKSIHHELTGTD